MQDPCFILLLFFDYLLYYKGVSQSQTLTQKAWLCKDYTPPQLSSRAVLLCSFRHVQYSQTKAVVKNCINGGLVDLVSPGLCVKRYQGRPGTGNRKLSSWFLSIMQLQRTPHSHLILPSPQILRTPILLPLGIPLSCVAKQQGAVWHLLSHGWRTPRQSVRVWRKTAMESYCPSPLPR